MLKIRTDIYEFVFRVIKHFEITCGLNDGCFINLWLEDISDTE